jgi:hypothetical protein
VNPKGLVLELVFFGVCEEEYIGSPFEILKLIVEDFCGEDP